MSCFWESSGVKGLMAEGIMETSRQLATVIKGSSAPEWALTPNHPLGSDCYRGSALPTSFSRRRRRDTPGIALDTIAQ